MEIMGLSFAEFLTALFSIVMIDLVLAGDNAIVIGLACCNLPKRVQMKGIVLGTVGAIIVRILATIAVVWLLQIQGLRLGGGILLVYIAYKLLVKQDKQESIQAKDSLLSAVFTIIVADAIMGLDNILAVAGAAHGSYIMVVFGLLISIPIMVFGSTLIIKLIERFPIIIDIGAAIIAYTAGNMITEEPLLHNIFVNPVLKYGLIVLIIVGVLIIGKKRIVSKAAFK